MLRQIDHRKEKKQENACQSFFNQPNMNDESSKLERF